MTKELNSKSLAYLKKIGLVDEILDELNDGKTTKADDAIKARDAKIVDTARESIANEIRAEVEDEQKEKLKDAQTGAHNAAKNKLADLAKSLGLPLQKSELEGKDFNAAISLFKEKVSEKIANSKEGEGKETESQRATIEELQAKLDEANRIITEQKTAIEKHPQIIQAEKEKVLTDIELQAKRKEILAQFEAKLLPAYKGDLGREALELLLEKEIQNKSIKFERITDSSGKSSFVPKVPHVKNGEILKDKNGETIYIPYTKDSTTTHTLESFYTTFFETKQLIAAQGDSSGANNQILPNNNQPLQKWNERPANPYQTTEFIN